MWKRLFIASLVINIVLAGVLVSSLRTARTRSMRLMADVTTAEVRLQAHILDELESDDPARVDAVLAMLRRNIEQGARSADQWRDAAGG